MQDLGPWDGERAPAPTDPRAAPATAAGARDGGLRLATWKQMVDHGSLQDGDTRLRATARRPVARLPRATYATPPASAPATAVDRRPVTAAR